MAGRLACGVAGLLAFAVLIGAAEAARGERIVFVVNRAGFSEIWTMAPDGSSRRRLTPLARGATDSTGATQPAWSPDGRSIAYVSAPPGVDKEDETRDEIYIMRADGSDRRRLTTNDLPDWSPAWSPDGNVIASARTYSWDSPQGPPRGSIVLLDIRTGAEREILVDRRGPTVIGNLAWSPGGALLAFTRSTAAQGRWRSSIHVVQRDGRGGRRLVRDGFDAQWAPDGSRLAFATTRDRFGRTCFHDCSPSPEVYVVRRNGSGVQRLTRSTASDGEPAWSPDGRWIAFVSDRSDPRGHAYEIYVVPAAGGPARQITRNRVWDLSPDWR